MACGCLNVYTCEILYIFQKLLRFFYFSAKYCMLLRGESLSKSANLLFKCVSAEGV